MPEDRLELAQVRKRVQAAIAAARDRSQLRRQRAGEAERAFETFLEEVATPMMRQVQTALKAEGHAFTVFTPGGSLRLASERSRDDFIELALDTDGDRPQVVGRISHTRGSRTVDDERPIRPGVGPEALSDEDVLDFLLHALEPWLER